MGSGSTIYPEMCRRCGGDVEAWWFSDHYSGGSGIRCTRPECGFTYTRESWEAWKKETGIWEEP